MSTENSEHSTTPAARRIHAQRQPQPIYSPASKLSQLEDAAYGRLLERADVKEALFRLDSAQAKRDSVSRKLCAGSAAVSVDDLSRWETELAAAKVALVTIADQAPLLQKHPMLSV